MQLISCHRNAPPFLEKINMNYSISLPKELGLSLIKNASNNGFAPENLDALASDDFTKSLYEFSSLNFGDTISSMKQHIDDDCIGITCLDIPIIGFKNPVSERMWGYIIAHSIVRNIFEPVIDAHQKTPFSLFRASNAGAEMMKNNGIALSSPETILDFHSDGLNSGSNVIISDYLALYNLVIRYNNPGSFHWVPYSMWDHYSEFSNIIGVNKKYRINLTPSITYNKQTGEIIKNEKSIYVPIFNNIDGKNSVFLNGNVIGSEDELNNITMMKNSIRNSRRISIPQKTRRLIVMKNSCGFHARDIFEGPQTNGGVTRSLIRNVSKEGLVLSQ